MAVSPIGRINKNPNIQEYAQYAKTLIKKFPTMHQLDVEKAYAKYLQKEKQTVDREDEKVRKENQSLKSKLSSMKEDTSKSSAVVAQSRAHAASIKTVTAKRIRIAAHQTRPITGHPVPAYSPGEQFPVITYSSSGLRGVTIPAGSRLFFAPACGGQNMGAWFHLPTTNPLFTTIGTLRPDLPHATISNLMWGADSIGFDAVGTPYQIELGGKSHSVIDCVGGSMEDAFFPDSDENPSSKQMVARTSLAKGSFEMDVTTTYNGTAVIRGVTTNSSGVRKSLTVLDATAVDNDGIVGFRMAQSLYGAGTTIENVIASISPTILHSSAQKSISANFGTLDPNAWWYAGEKGQDPTVTSYDELNRVQWVQDNPFFNALISGCFVTVDAVSADVIVSVNILRTNHLEFSHEIGGHGTHAVLLEAQQGNAHFTNNHPEVKAQHTFPRSQMAIADNPNAARRALDLKLGFPPGSTRAVVSLEGGRFHPPPQHSKASDLWNDVKAGMHFVKENKSEIVDGIKSGYEFVKGVGETLNDLKGMFGMVE